MKGEEAIREAFMVAMTFDFGVEEYEGSLPG